MFQNMINLLNLTGKHLIFHVLLEIRTLLLNIHNFSFFSQIFSSLLLSVHLLIVVVIFFDLLDSFLILVSHVDLNINCYYCLNYLMYCCYCYYSPCVHHSLISFEMYLSIVLCSSHHSQFYLSNKYILLSKKSIQSHSFIVVVFFLSFCFLLLF